MPPKYKTDEEAALATRWRGLDLSNRGLTCIRTSITVYGPLIKTLNVSGNGLSRIPEGIIRGLPALQQLNLENNLLTSLPVDLGNCESLEVLNISHNRLENLPHTWSGLLSLRSLRADGNPLVSPPGEVLQKGAQTVLGWLREHRPPPACPPPRKMISVSPPLDTSRSSSSNMAVLKPPGTTVMSFNILAERYATGMYRYCPQSVLSWPARRKHIQKILSQEPPSIICLQEVELKEMEYLRPSAHFHSLYFQKGRGHDKTPEHRASVDGCAILWDSRRYTHVRSSKWIFRDLALNSIFYDSSREGWSRIAMRDNVALGVILMDHQSGQNILVVNTHVHWDPRFADVKLVQVYLLCTAVQELRYRMQMQSIPVVMCGDFNSLPDSAVYELLSKGFVSTSHHAFADYDYGDLLMDVALTLPQGLSLLSAYGTALGQEPEFTNYTTEFKGVIDYIWFSGEQLEVQEVLELPPLSAMDPTYPLPNPFFPSDHVDLRAKFAFKPPSLWWMDPPMQRMRNHPHQPQHYGGFMSQHATHTQPHQPMMFSKFGKQYLPYGPHVMKQWENPYPTTGEPLQPSASTPPIPPASQKSGNAGDDPAPSGTGNSSGPEGIAISGISPHTPRADKRGSGNNGIPMSPMSPGIKSGSVTFGAPPTPTKHQDSSFTSSSMAGDATNHLYQSATGVKSRSATHSYQRRRSRRC